MTIQIKNQLRDCSKSKKDLELKITELNNKLSTCGGNTEEIDKEMDTYDLGELKSLAKKLRIGFA